MRIEHILAGMAMVLPCVASAEVVSSSPSHFALESKAVVAASPAETYAMLGRVGSWWNSDHSYSGDAANLTIEPRAGGCFCEALPGGGSVEHMRVVYAQPGKLLRLQGGLGPLQGEAVAGTLSWTLKPVAAGTEITLSYRIAGHIEGGAAALAGPVDTVLTQQLTGLQAALAR